MARDDQVYFRADADLRRRLDTLIPAVVSHQLASGSTRISRSDVVRLALEIGVQKLEQIVAEKK